MFVSWYFYRSLSSAHLKKKAKAVPSATPISSQYLGTLKVLEDKRVQKNSTKFDKADSLRAAVFQVDPESKQIKNEQNNQQNYAYKGPVIGVDTSYFLEIKISEYIPCICLQV